MMVPQIRAIDHAEITRYVINGVLATAIHYSVLTFNVKTVGMQSAGFANFIAAVFGISASFLGSRYFVFKKHDTCFINQVITFIFLYLSIACIHGLVLFGWTDVYGYDYRSGFILATLFQMTLSYAGNKALVFK